MIQILQGRPYGPSQSAPTIFVLKRWVVLWPWKKSGYSDEEGRFMYKIDQSHVTIFCNVFVWLGGPRSPVRIIAQVQWFVYQNWLEPSGGIYHLYKRKWSFCLKLRKEKTVPVNQIFFRHRCFKLSYFYNFILVPKFLDRKNVLLCTSW